MSKVDQLYLDDIKRKLAAAQAAMTKLEDAVPKLDTQAQKYSKLVGWVSGEFAHLHKNVSDLVEKAPNLDLQNIYRRATNQRGKISGAPGVYPVLSKLAHPGFKLSQRFKDKAGHLVSACSALDESLRYLAEDAHRKMALGLDDQIAYISDTFR